MAARTTPADDGVRRGRLAKAVQFATAAEAILDLSDETAEVTDAYVTLCVHAGIAAADAICASRLGVHARGENHRDAVALLAAADRGASHHLAVLLTMKTRAGYSHLPVSRERAVRAGRAMDALLDTARRLTPR